MKSVASLLAACACWLLLVMSGAAADLAWPVPEWQASQPKGVDMSAEGLDKVRLWLKDNGSKTGLVVRRGRIVGEWYFDEATAESKYLVFSTSKSFASTAAGILIEQGKLSLDTKVGSLLSDVKPAEKRDITVEQILSMTTGVHNQPVKDVTKIFSYAMYEAPMDHPPGKHWEYNNVGLALLSPLVAKATGKELDEVLDQHVFQPIGIASGDWTWDRNEGHPLSYSGLHITARGLARFGLLFQRKGKWQDRQIVSADWVAKATAPSQELNKTYGYLWWNNSTSKWPGVPRDAYAALGAHNNSMLIVPSLELIVLRQVGDDSANKRKMEIGQLWKLACDAIDQPGIARNE